MTSVWKDIVPRFLKLKLIAMLPLLILVPLILIFRFLVLDPCYRSARHFGEDTVHVVKSVDAERVLCGNNIPQYLTLCVISVLSGVSAMFGIILIPTWSYLYHCATKPRKYWMTILVLLLATYFAHSLTMRLMNAWYGWKFGSVQMVIEIILYTNLFAYVVLGCSVNQVRLLWLWETIAAIVFIIFLVTLNTLLPRWFLSSHSELLKGVIRVVLIPMCVETYRLIMHAVFLMYPDRHALPMLTTAPIVGQTIGRLLTGSMQTVEGTAVVSLVCSTTNLLLSITSAERDRVFLKCVGPMSQTTVTSVMAVSSLLRSLLVHSK